MSLDLQWVFLVYFLVFELGSLLCGLATSSKMLIVGRAVAGMGSAGLMSGGLNIIAGTVSIERRPSMWTSIFCHESLVPRVMRTDTVILACSYAWYYDGK